MECQKHLIAISYGIDAEHRPGANGRGRGNLFEDQGATIHRTIEANSAVMAWQVGFVKNTTGIAQHTGRPTSFLTNHAAETAENIFEAGQAENKCPTQPMAFDVCHFPMNTC